MPDIFLSYSRQDVAVAGQMAAVLAAAGHDVWWDREIRAGDVYDQVLENALRASRLVIVLWSKTAVVSDWVRSEATVAMQSGTLMPVMIEDCQRPVAFELRQSADLIGWKGNEKDPRLAAVLAEVARQLGAPAAVTKPAVVPTGPNRRLVIGGAAGVAALAAGGFGAWRAFGGKADDGTASVVVLPFANLSGDPEQAYFSDGIAEELRNALSQIRGLKVIGRVSSEQFRDAKDLSVAAEKLGVDHVLTGSVRRSPTTIRIGAQLVEGRTGVESWSQSYDQPVGDSLAIQTKIATNVVAALSAKLGAAAGDIIVGGTRDPEAQSLFLKGASVFFSTRSKSGLEEAGRLTESALALDPSYAEAWAGLGNIRGNLRAFSTSSVEQAGLLEEALAASRRAVVLAPNSGFVNALAAYRLLESLDVRQAMIDGRRAMALAPADGRVLNATAQIVRTFDPDEAVIIMQGALSVDPLNPFYYETLGASLVWARRFDEAEAAARRAAALSNNQRGGNALFAALLALGRIEEARAMLGNIPFEAVRLAFSAIVDARAGNRIGSDAAMVALRQRNDLSLNYRLASAHAQRGETGQALDAIEASQRRREPNLVQIAVNEWFDPIRSEPRFKAVRDAVIPPDLWVPPKRG